MTYWTGAKVKEIRERLGFSQDQLAEELRLEGPNRARTVRRWESDNPTISGPAGRALESIAIDHGIVVPE